MRSVRSPWNWGEREQLKWRVPKNSSQFLQSFLLSKYLVEAVFSTLWRLFHYQDQSRSKIRIAYAIERAILYGVGYFDFFRRFFGRKNRHRPNDFREGKRTVRQRRLMNTALAMLPIKTDTALRTQPVHCHCPLCLSAVIVCYTYPLLLDFNTSTIIFEHIDDNWYLLSGVITFIHFIKLMTLNWSQLRQRRLMNTALAMLPTKTDAAFRTQPQLT